MEMINKAAYADLKKAGMENEQALAVAAHIPDWSTFTTRRNLVAMELRMVLYLVGLLTVAVLWGLW